MVEADQKGASFEHTLSTYPCVPTERRFSSASNRGQGGAFECEAGSRQSGEGSGDLLGATQQDLTGMTDGNRAAAIA